MCSKLNHISIISNPLKYLSFEELQSSLQQRRCPLWGNSSRPNSQASHSQANSILNMEPSQFRHGQLMELHLLLCETCSLCWRPYEMGYLHVLYEFFSLKVLCWYFVVAVTFFKFDNLFYWFCYLTNYSTFLYVMFLNWTNLSEVFTNNVRGTTFQQCLEILGIKN